MVSATTFQIQPFFGAPLTVDTTRAQTFFGDEEDTSILDENILDHSALDSGLDMSPPTADSRRDSFAVSASLFSPKTENWQPVDMRSVPSNNPFLPQHTNNPFMQAPQQTAAPFQGPWGAVTSSGSATPLQPCYDGLPTEFDAGVSLFQQRAPPMQQQGHQTPFSNPSNQVPMFQELGAAHGHHHGSIPPSPGQKDQWMAASHAQHAAAAAHNMAKRSRPASPLLRSHNELRRGDGIRKKNARFDIPAERNLSNIDTLIAQTTDEQEIKELKQQKRLLRNRQAALDSRQRKKQHTERLEDEKKQFTEAMNGMQDEMARLEQDMARLLREKAGYEAYIGELEHKQADMIAQHTLETGTLRKRIGVLVQALEGQTQQQQQQNQPQQNQHQPVPMGGFGPDFADMEGLTMDVSSGWDAGMQFGEFAPPPSLVDQQPQPQQPAPVTQREIKQEMQQQAIIVKPSKPTTEVSFPAVEEHPGKPQSGLLFMLFLVGAFVLSSRGSTTKFTTVDEGLRSASANILETVLKDAGVPQTASASSTASASAPIASASEAGSSSSSWSSVPTVVGGADNGVAPSMLVDMADALTQPTEQQANEQLFGLSAAQYDGVVSGPESPVQFNRPTTSQGRRNLADALANMNVHGGESSRRMSGSGTKESVSEVYTRSLLWDQIPSDVVRTFAKMVAESNKNARTTASKTAEA